MTDVYAEALSAEVSSGAFVKVAGQSHVVELKASSGGTLNASALKADNGKARASSGGSVKSAIRYGDIERSSGGSVSNSSGN